jgi:hypothetical protein
MNFHSSDKGVREVTMVVISKTLYLSIAEYGDGDGDKEESEPVTLLTVDNEFRKLFLAF